MKGCPRCQGLSWVCENHPEKAWDAMLGCECGAGMPCPNCNDLAKDGIDEPDISDVLMPDPLQRPGKLYQR